jgi:hypothetical protein
MAAGTRVAASWVKLEPRGELPPPLSGFSLDYYDGVCAFGRQTWAAAACEGAPWSRGSGPQEFHDL